MRNLITDVAGVQVGNADDRRVVSGVTAIVFDEPAVASAAILGGAPGGRETTLLEPEMTVGTVDAFVLSGGSAFGLAAGDGAMAALAARGRGFQVGTARIPIVPQAILFDLMNGGDKDWGDISPYRTLGIAAVEATDDDFALGAAGAGYGATTATLWGGLGSASSVTAGGLTVGAIVAVNSVGSVLVGDGPHFWAAPFEYGEEYGGLGWPSAVSAKTLRTDVKGGLARPAPGRNTTIAVIATNAKLDKSQCKRLALAAHDGFARAIRPAHTPLDGDTIFCAATGQRPLADPLVDLTELTIAAADTLARAVARGVFAATPRPTAAAPLPTWQERFGGQIRTKR